MFYAVYEMGAPLLIMYCYLILSSVKEKKNIECTIAPVIRLKWDWEFPFVGNIHVLK